MQLKDLNELRETVVAERENPGSRDNADCQFFAKFTFTFRKETVACSVTRQAARCLMKSFSSRGCFSHSNVINQLMHSAL